MSKTLRGKINYNKLSGHIENKKIVGTPNLHIERVYPDIIDLDIVPKNIKQVFTHENEYGYDKITVDPILEYGKIYNDVQFIDQTGTVLYHYSLEELQELDELPPVPEKEGLISQGWNWTLEELKSANMPMDVGAQYVTDDGKTRIYLRLHNRKRKVTLWYYQSAKNSLKIDWGDGTIITSSTQTTTTVTHTYKENLDEVVIKMWALNGATIGFYANNSSGNSAFGSSSTTPTRHDVYKIEIGSDPFRISDYSLYELSNLEELYLSTSVTGIQTYAFANTRNLKALIIPRGLTSFGQNFSAGSGMYYWSLPNTISKISYYFCYQTTRLTRLCVPPSLTTNSRYFVCQNKELKELYLPDDFQITQEGSNTFIYENRHLVKIHYPKNQTLMFGIYNNSSLRDINLPDKVEVISGSSFWGSLSLYKMVFPETVRTVGSQAFQYCSGILEYDFSKLKSVPTTSNAFSNLDASAKIVVPDDLYDEWITTTGWSNYKSYIVKASDYKE